EQAGPRARGEPPAVQVPRRPAALGPDDGRPARAGRRRGPAMTADPTHLEHARKVADTVLYEGYVLYPYRRSAQKNRTRFQFGVLMPPPYRCVDACEPSASQTECLVECPHGATVDVGLPFLPLPPPTPPPIAPAPAPPL